MKWTRLDESRVWVSKLTIKISQSLKNAKQPSIKFTYILRKRDLRIGWTSVGGDVRNLRDDDSIQEMAKKND